MQPDTEGVFESDDAPVSDGDTAFGDSGFETLIAYQLDHQRKDCDHKPQSCGNCQQFLRGGGVCVIRIAADNIRRIC